MSAAGAGIILALCCCSSVGAVALLSKVASGQMRPSKSASFGTAGYLISTMKANSSWESSAFGTAGYSRNCRTAPIGDSDQEIFSGWKPSNEKARQWTELPPAQSKPREPKLAMLMFIKDEVFNAELWGSWMKHAKADRLEFSLLIHAYGVSPGSNLTQAMFEPHFVHEQAPTNWCDIFEAEILLLRKALKDPAVTHVATLSADSVPLKPLGFMYQEIKREPATRMCFDFNWSPAPRAETWWLMTRSDAEMFLDHADLARSFKYGCSEENTWAYPLLLRKSRWKDAAPLRNECTMFTDWIYSCKEWANHADRCQHCEHLRSEPHVDASAAHPRSYSHVGKAAWEELLRSPFWWGRKFSDKSFAQVGDPWAMTAQQK